MVVASCVTQSVPKPLPGQPIFGSQLSFHRILEGEQTAGFVSEVKFNSEQLGHRFLVQNSFRQNVGYVDSNGLAYRYSVTNGEAEHVATGTMEDSVRAILGLSGPIQFVREK